MILSVSGTFFELPARLRHGDSAGEPGRQVQRQGPAQAGPGLHVEKRLDRLQEEPDRLLVG